MWMLDRVQTSKHKTFQYFGFAQDLVEGLRDELSLRNSQADEDSLKGGSQHDPIPEAIKQHVSDLIESTTQVLSSSGPY